jgi:thioredoxin reductase (NADPH)
MVHRTKVTIIGAGPAGIAAAIYLQRAGITPQILEKDKPGGLLRNAYLVENYPGFPNGIEGEALADLFMEQFHKLGLSITPSEVTQVSRKKNSFIIDTDHDRIISSAIIIAAGTVPRALKLPGSASVIGTRLFYEPRLLPIKEKDERKKILVIGGGDIAFDYALTLISWGHEVSIISRSQPKCLALLYARVKKTKTTIYRCSPKEIIASPNTITIRCWEKNKHREFPADFILVACGREPNTKFLTSSLKKWYDRLSNSPHSMITGLYFAGDIVRGANRQTGIAVGDGIYTAMMAEKYLKTR